jgi:hypothetical protein
MFTAEYFRTQLQRDIEALGGEPVVEVYLVNGHSHRVRSVIEMPQGYVMLEVYQSKGDPLLQGTKWGAAATTGAPSSAAGGVQETRRVAISYESLVEVRIDPSESHARVRPGFAAD